MANIDNEKIIVNKMIRLHCRAHHGEVLCDDCRQLIAYADYRLSNCRHSPNKPSCKNCTTHCYAPAQRDKIRQIMREIGPQMLFRMPVATLRHLLKR